MAFTSPWRRATHTNKPPMTTIGYTSTAGDLFLQPIIRRFQSKYEVINLLRQDGRGNVHLHWPPGADLLWIEWANALISAQDLRSPRKASR